MINISSAKLHTAPLINKQMKLSPLISIHLFFFNRKRKMIHCEMMLNTTLHLDLSLLITIYYHVTQCTFIIILFPVV